MKEKGAAMMALFFNFFKRKEMARQFRRKEVAYL
jgi:hypothetical protein